MGDPDRDRVLRRGRDRSVRRNGRLGRDRGFGLGDQRGFGDGRRSKRFELGIGIGFGIGFGDGHGVGFGIGFGFGVGVGVGVGVELGIGFGFGVGRRFGLDDSRSGEARGLGCGNRCGLVDRHGQAFELRLGLGLGFGIGVLIFAMVRVPKSNAEFLAVVLGAIAFASGLAGFLHLSPIVICFIAGVLVTNFPNEQRDSIFQILNHLERPVHLLFLIVAGAVWDVGDWRGWALVPLFVLGRLIGKYSGSLASKTAVGALLPAGFADNRSIVTPMSGLSTALVVSVGSLYHDTGLAWVVTAVIGGSIVTEVLVQATTRDEGTVRAPVDELASSAPHHELDELEDDQSESAEMPIYRDAPETPTRATSKADDSGEDKP